jgi:hypothetical protein
VGSKLASKAPELYVSGEMGSAFDDVRRRKVAVQVDDMVLSLAPWQVTDFPLYKPLPPSSMAERLSQLVRFLSGVKQQQQQLLPPPLDSHNRSRVPVVLQV